MFCRATERPEADYALIRRERPSYAHQQQFENVSAQSVNGAYIDSPAGILLLAT
jgi:hypothetical protein